MFRIVLVFLETLSHQLIMNSVFYDFDHVVNFRGFFKILRWFYKFSWPLGAIFAKIRIAFLASSLIKVAIILFEWTRVWSRCCETTFMPKWTVLAFINSFKLEFLFRNHRTFSWFISSRDSFSWEPHVIFRSRFEVINKCWPSGHGRGYWPGWQMYPAGQVAHPPFNEAPDIQISIFPFGHWNPGGQPAKHSQSNLNKSLSQTSFWPRNSVTGWNYKPLPIGYVVRKFDKENIAWSKPTGNSDSLWIFLTT